MSIREKIGLWIAGKEKFKAPQGCFPFKLMQGGMESMSGHGSIGDTIVERSLSQSRRDMEDVISARQQAQRRENPRQTLLQTLYSDIIQDPMVESQMQLRISRTLRSEITVNGESGEYDEKATKKLLSLNIIEPVIKGIIEAKLYGNSVIEFIPNGSNDISASIIPRAHISPLSGMFYPDCDGEQGIRYRNLKEYGRSILEFDCSSRTELGLLNRIMPHVYIKRFAMSCWSEFCEIHGIPPRVLKTDTTSPEMLNRAEQMMRNIGSAAWFIIDSSEDFNFASSLQNSDGSVYNNIIRHCNNEIGMLITGAILGQDTVNGNRSKEEAGMHLTENIILSDFRYVISSFDNIVFPALAATGLMPSGCSLNIARDKDIEGLWKRTHEAMQYYNVDPEWIRSEFGIEVTGLKNTGSATDLSRTEKLNAATEILLNPEYNVFEM